RLAAAHTRASEDQCYPPHPDCSPNSSKQCPTAAPGTSTRFPLSSDTDLPLFRSGVGIPLRCWPHARLFSDLLSGPPFFALAARRFASRSACFRFADSCAAPNALHAVTPSSIPHRKQSNQHVLQILISPPATLHTSF